MSQTDSQPDVAVIGMACRFPGAENTDALWRLLCQGRSGIRPVDDVGQDADFARHGKKRVPYRGELESVDCFDAGFFGTTPRDARDMDPQHRVWLECVWEAVEDAGYAGRLEGSFTGVFATCGRNTYLMSEIVSRSDLTTEILDRRSAVNGVLSGNEPDFLALRTSDKLDLHGPSMVIQCACASALVAVSQACQSLLDHGSDLCIAGGVQISFPQHRGYFYEPGGIRSPDGRVRTLDEDANGTVFSDGAGVVVLKRLEDALESGDQVQAVIKGWATNNDGRSRASMSAPDARGQAEAISMAQGMAEIPAQSIGYVELHGTGTRIGDAIELEALHTVFGTTGGEPYCGLGSIKSNIGHLDAAAGIAGLIKTVLMLRHGAIPPTLHVQNPRKELLAANSPFYAAQLFQEWTSETPRRAGVSAFGVGGVNCHLVLEQSPDLKQSRDMDFRGDLPGVLTLSALSSTALRELTSRFQQHLSTDRDQSVGDICFTTNVGRRHFQYRSATVCPSLEHACNSLMSLADGRAVDTVRSSTVESHPVRVVFMFPGHGAGSRGTGRLLYQSCPVYRASIDNSDSIIRDLSGGSLCAFLYGEWGDSAPTAIEQCAGVAVGLALNALWQDWGVTPQTVVGQSLGEITAACVSGIIDEGEALSLAWQRGLAISEHAPAGKMMTVFTSGARIAELLRTTAVEIAAVNAPESIVVAGHSRAIRELSEELVLRDILFRILPGDVPYHCSLMDPVVEELGRAIASLRFSRPRIPLLSSLTGEPGDAEMSRASYWVEQIGRCVRLDRTLETIAGDHAGAIVELGASDTVTTVARNNQAAPMALASLRPGRDDGIQIMETLASLYEFGIDPVWERIRHGNYNRVSLPTYPFERRRFWYQPGQHGSKEDNRDGSAPGLLGRRLDLPLSDEVRFENCWDLDTQPWLDDHRLFGVVVVPGSAIVSMLVGAMIAFDGYSDVSDLVFRQPLILSPQGECSVQLIGKPARGMVELTLMARATPGDHRWERHVDATLGSGGGTRPVMDIESIKARCTDSIEGSRFYEEHWAQGPQTGPYFRRLAEIWSGPNRALGRVRESGNGARIDPLHPGVVEAAFQLLYCCDEIETAELVRKRQSVLVPFRIRRIRTGRLHPRSGLYCRATITGRDEQPGRVCGNITILDDGGELVLEFEGFELRSLAHRSLTRSAAGDNRSESFGGVRDSTIRTPARKTEPVSVIESVRDTVARLVGVEPGSVGYQEPLYSLGVDSLLVISLRDEILTRFEVGIPIDDLLDDQTVAGLAALISAQHPGTDQVPDQTAGDESPIGSGSTLTRLKGDPGGNVVFFVTADALTPMAMMPLAKAMQLDRPVYSLHAPGLETDESPPENIEALADRYLADMRLIQPAGPYTLVGRCAGGVAAFEIALRLQEIDEQIRNLILLESLPPPVPESMDGEQAATAQWYRERQHRIHDEIAHRLAVLPTRVSRRFRAVQHTIDKAVAAYDPKEVFYGDLVLCRSNMDSHPLQQAWQTLIVGRLRTLDVPGNHVTMFDKPIVASLGAILGRVLGH